MRKTFVTTLLSGGMDSIATLHLAHQLRSGWDQHIAFSVDYGQPHRCELLHAARVCDRLGIQHWTICVADALMPGRVGLHTPSPMALDAKGRDTAVIPARNLVLLSLAACHVVSRFPHRTYLFYLGCNRDDAERFPDCTSEFFTAAEKALSAALGEVVAIAAPFGDTSKVDVLRWAALHPDALDDCARSWSCYAGKPTPCGTCTACVSRAKAFAESGIEDRAEYLAAYGGDVHRNASLRR